MAAHARSPRKGHRRGGPSRLYAIAALGIVLGACSGAPGPAGPSPDARDGGVLRPLQAYRQAGLIAGPERFPVVASFSTMAGPGDSTYVVFALSIPNSALRFERGSEGFVGRYEVDLSFQRDGEEVRSVQGREVVRVSSFAETGRTDESVVFQTLVALEPGSYTVEVEARDAQGPRGFTAEETLDVPDYHATGRSLSRPVFVYRAQGRPTELASPDLIVNPRNTIAYGGDSPLVYVEGYGYPPDLPVTLRVLGPDDDEVWSTEVRLESGEAELSHALVEIPSQVLPVGRLWLELASAGAEGEEREGERVPLLVTISDQWMVSNFDEVLEFLSYIASRAELDSLRNADPQERTELWDRFWERRNPTPASPVNEFRERFFERVRTATLAFSEPGRPGWRTDRGEVFIVLGAPDYVQERYSTDRRNVSGRPDALEWVYERGPMGRMSLFFVSRHGIERYELTPSSRTTFHAAAARLRPRSE